MKALARAATAIGPISTRAQIVATACACAVVSVVIFEVDPHRHAVYPQCLLYKTTSLYCPGCGSTRALYALLHGRVREALHDNVLFVAAVPLLLAWGLTHMVTAWKTRVWPKVQLEQPQVVKIGLALLGLLILFAFVRNLPGWPFSFLRPL